MDDTFGLLVDLLKRYKNVDTVQKEVISAIACLADVGRYTQSILGECLLISSLPGKAFRTLVDIAGLAERFNKRSQSRTW